MFADHNTTLPSSSRCFKCVQSQDAEEAGQRGKQDNTMGKSFGMASGSTEGTA